MAELIGSVLGGCELLETVGRGGMGEVYRAHQRSLDRHVAVKVLPVGMGEDHSFVDRFIQEARSIARLSHPNVVQVYDTGEAEGYYYIIMELIDGGTLKDRVAGKQAPGHLDIMDLMEQAATGLDAAHQQGIIHRDIKPGNIMFAPNQLVKVADFGLAKAINADSELTGVGEIVGTPAYMSPEQCEGRALDHRTDIYSLGATVYHYATGRPPFTADQPLQIMYKHLTEPPDLVSDVRADLPVNLACIVDRCLAKDPHDRYQDAGELIMDLRHAAEGKSIAPYTPGEGKSHLSAQPGDATAILKPMDVSAAGMRRSTTIHKKRELSAKEQEHRADAMADKGQWAFALLAYKEALKSFPDSDDLKNKLADAQEHVDREAMADSVLRARRLVGEGRFAAAYDVIGRAIETAGNVKLKNRARIVLTEIEAGEQLVRAARKKRIIMALTLLLAVAVGAAFAYRHWKKITASIEQPPPKTLAAAPEDAGAKTPDTADTGTTPPDGKTAEDTLPDNPILRAIVEAAMGKDEGERAQDRPAATPDPALVPEPPPWRRASPAVTYSRTGFADRRVTFAIPDYMKPIKTDTEGGVSGTELGVSGDEFIAFAGRSPDGAILSVSVTRGRTTASPEEVADEAQKNFVDPDRYNGRLTGVGRAFRFVPHVGRCPEIRGRYQNEQGVHLAMFTLVISAGDYTNILSFTVSFDMADEYYQEYTRLVSSISAR